MQLYPASHSLIGKGNTQLQPELTIPGELGVMPGSCHMKLLKIVCKYFEINLVLLGAVGI